jgi:hypothetical protein
MQGADVTVTKRVSLTSDFSMFQMCTRWCAAGSRRAAMTKDEAVQRLNQFWMTGG